MTVHSTNDFIPIIAERGFVAQCTDTIGLSEKMKEGPITAYVGFDATAESLHVGHLVSLMSMRWLAACGHRVIALVGGATTMVGDPSFRNAARPLLSPDVIDRNIGSITANIRQVMGEHADKLIVVNNADWLGKVGMIDFMRDVGSHFSVARMLTMESVKTRLSDSAPLSMLEFCYMLLQSADFLELFRKHDCVLQMGGSDQWGNICNGIELVRRTENGEVFGLTTNLLTTADGKKMGKTQNGAIWLDSSKLDPFSFWQFWRNVDDADLERFLSLFTDLPMDQVREMATGTVGSINKAKIDLANRVTALIHGEVAASQCEAKARMLFARTSTEVTHGIDVDETGIGVVDLIKRLGVAKTSGEARRLIEGKAVKLDDQTCEDVRETLFKRTEPFRISVGKRFRAVVALRD